MLLDPFDWATTKNDIREWEESTGLLIGPCGIPTQLNVFKFLDSRAVIRKEERHLIESGIPADLATLIDRANQHEKWLTMLGILPNQFRKILKRSSKAPDTTWDDISRTLFWNGYRIWTKRKHLYKEFWKNIAPDEWKSHKDKKYLKKRQKENASQCRDPILHGKSTQLHQL